NDRATDPRATNEAGKQRGEFVGLAQQAEPGGIEPRRELCPRLIGSTRGRLPDPYVGHYAEELIHARPGNGPRIASLTELAQQRERPRVLLRLTPVRVNEHVRVDCNHLTAAVDG